ncbi:hypothetical protein E2C01_083237 [Portunus trituberculatus]|uniref:Uncharacterized protein n=1 Tax=Portunus trituberculatus TaxID=210409 RepID=A0A5B7J2Y9_PORTR|nr:hypothetical protein [Portunus trituberculatus]
MVVGAWLGVGGLGPLGVRPGYLRDVHLHHPLPPFPLASGAGVVVPLRPRGVHGVSAPLPRAPQVQRRCGVVMVRGRGHVEVEWVVMVGDRGVGGRGGGGRFPRRG